MKQFGQLKEYSVSEINGILDMLRQQYDVVRIVDVEECRILEVRPNGSIHYGDNCFNIWGRGTRCANCSSYRACMTHTNADKTECKDHIKESIHSIPIYLETLTGELELCVIECVKLLQNDNGPDTCVDDDSAEYLSAHDVLTRLYTQEKLFREIRHRLSSDAETTYMMVITNIRNFRLVNQLFGIEGGNRILVGVANILRSECTHEEIYGRYRDDRFVLLVKKDRFHEGAFAEHLQKAEGLVESPIFTVQVKLGAYEITDVDMPIAAMIDHAELAVGAIRDSRDQLIAHYSPDMLAKRKLDQYIITEFEQALSGDEFKIYLQPQVREDGKINGAEALVRWVRPDGTVLPPGEFLHVLHQSELLSHLDVHVWEKAIRLLKRWEGTEFDDLYVSINVDPTDFYYVDVPKTLSGLCVKHGVDPRRLRVEITETALVEDVERQSRMVETLQSAGFLVEIDDFGKGFSSLSLLKDIHADVLKIDMGFVQARQNRERSAVILESVIGMAENLKMGVITEGVETRDQVDKLLKIGCHNFQGFFYSRPIPVSDFEAVVRDNLQMHGSLK